MFDSSHAFVENFPIFNVLFNVFNSSSDEMAVLNQHSEFIHINTSYMNTIGYTKPDKILGLSYEYFKGEACEQADVFKHQDKKVLLTQEPFEFLAYHRYADGNWKLLHGEKTCLYDHNQQPCGIFSKAKDVSNHPLYDISRFLLMETDSKSGKINRQSFVYHIKRAHHSTLLTRKELEVLFYF
jgi:PAS domain S-box-containing protein